MKALIVYGGWDGHEPAQVADIFAAALKDNDSQVELSDTLDCLLDAGILSQLDLIVPEWTMGEITADRF